MTKLHEIIAVEPELKGDAQKALAQLRGILEHPQTFQGEIRTYEPLEENGEPFPSEVDAISTTIPEVLDLLRGAYGAWIDVTLQKECSNTTTEADVVVDGKVIFSKLPAPALLNLESRLEELRGFYATLPTLDVTKSWKFSEADEIFVSDPITTYRTKKLLRNHVKSEATDKFPAQVDVYTEDARVGTWTKVLRSGAITLKSKRQMLARLETLLRAVKQARQRANDTEATLDAFSEKIFSYINDGAV